MPILYSNECYTLSWDAQSGVVIVEAGRSRLVRLPVSITVDALGRSETESIPRLLPESESLEEGSWAFLSHSSLWGEKRTILRAGERNISLRCECTGDGQAVDYLRFGYRRGDGGAIRAHADFKTLYAPRFDWSRGVVHASPSTSESLSCHQWLSPPPFFYGWEVDAGWCGAGLAVKRGEYTFVSFDHIADDGGFHLELTYEGHTAADGVFVTPEHILFPLPAADEESALSAYVDYLEECALVSRPSTSVPAWWREPLFCGWGQQRFDFRADHDGHENGNWVNAGDYATETFYRRCLDVLAEQGVDPGIVIIDCFWAAEPSRAEPHPLKWRDMRAFIDEQHRARRKVLLWLTPVITEGLPPEACMTLGGDPVAADPTSPVWREFFGAEVRRMVSSVPGGLDADGFKIDFTQNIPAERAVFRNRLTSRWGIISEEESKCYPALGDIRDERIACSGGAWGVELIKLYLQGIRRPMKAEKPDSLLITHTANPYFAEEVDMLRLNDMDGTSPDVLEIMSHRAAIARCCHPGWLVDTDNDLMIDKTMWRAYIALQPGLGNPDTYYATGIAQSGERFDEDDYALLRETFRRYREQLAAGRYAGRLL